MTSSETCFNDYSRYYDLMYRDRDYAAEADALCRYLGKYAPSARSLLELGCGTGRLAGELLARGYRLHGLDLSESMLEAAARLQRGLPDRLAGHLSFSRADARSFSLGTRFDAVIAMFHVMSYQQTNDDLLACLASVSAHLEPGGVFLFDFWYGPAVLKQRPEKRIRHVEDDAVRLTRTAEPILRANADLVEVGYRIEATDRRTGQTEVISEIHCMRYLFLPELAAYLNWSGFELVETLAWPEGGVPDENSWGVACVARKLLR